MATLSELEEQKIWKAFPWAVQVYSEREGQHEIGFCQTALAGKEAFHQTQVNILPQKGQDEDAVTSLNSVTPLGHWTLESEGPRKESLNMASKWGKELNSFYD